VSRAAALGWTRRQILAGAFWIAAGLAARAAGAPRSAIGWVPPRGLGHSAAENGLALALEEAARAAALLGAEPPALVRIPALREAQAGVRGELLAVLWAADREALPRNAELPVLTVVPLRGPPIDGVLQVASSEELRHAALSRLSIYGERAVRVVDWHPALERYGAAQLNERYARRFGRPMDESAWAAWCAAKAVHEALLRAASPDPAALRQALVALVFDGHKGRALRFGADGVLAQPRYAVDARGELLGEVPA
jgi:hypothetical protein